MEAKGICLCKQETNVEDSSRTIVMMVQEAGVRAFAIGGRPQTGPMQPVGGTKGSLVLQSQYLAGISAYVVEEFASTRQEARQWQSFLPTGFGINANDASVNF